MSSSLLSPEQRRRRDRLERLFKLAEPGLNLLLAAGERVSRVVQRGEGDYYPPQRAHLPHSTNLDDAGRGAHGKTAPRQ